MKRIFEFLLGAASLSLLAFIIYIISRLIDDADRENRKFYIMYIIVFAVIVILFGLAFLVAYIRRPRGNSFLAQTAGTPSGTSA